jgi:hypothetical protein
MNISLSFSLEVLIIIGILYWIIVINTLHSCCNVPKIIETMKNLAYDNDNEY